MPGRFAHLTNRRRNGIVTKEKKAAVADAMLTLRAAGAGYISGKPCLGFLSIEYGFAVRPCFFVVPGGCPFVKMRFFRTVFKEVLSIATSGKKEMEINGQIRDKELRVIDADGSQMGIMTTADALKLAEERDLDLVKIAPMATPPVVKVMDYGKYKFEQQKKEKEARKNQKVVDIKEIRLSLKIDTGDFNTKVGHAAKFLQSGDKVKVSIRFRGREMAHAAMGLDVHRRFAEALPDAVVEKPPKLEGRSMIMFLTPAAGKDVAKKSEKKPADAPKVETAKAEAPKAEAPKAEAQSPATKDAE